MVLKTVSTLGGGGGGGGTPGGANSTIQFNSSGSFGGSANLTWDGGNVQIGSSGIIKLSNGVTNYVGFNAPTIIPANVTWTLPSTDGATGNFLITNGSGTLSWAAANLTPIAPSNYALPVVSGNTTVGQTLSSTTGSWNGYPAPTYAYQWVRGASNIANATSATYPLVDLDYNNTIKVIVIASNSAGNATANSVATANIAGTVPGAPTIGTATAGNAQAAVSFTAPAVTGGPAITSYTATSSPGGITGSAASSPITVSGLTNGTAYTFTVTATNSIGTGAASAASNSVTPTAVVQDASFAYIPLLLETTSTNGQNNQGTTTTNGFLDSSTANGGSGFTITRSGTLPTQGSSTPYWPAGQWSNFFSSSYLSVVDSASLRFGAANFTIEAWVFRTTSGATHTIAAKGASTPTGWVLQVSSADKLVFIDTSTSITGATSLAANTWYYVAVVRAGTGASQTTLYVNGVSDGTGTSATTFSQTDAMRIGTDRSAANNFSGYISNLRLSNTNLTISSTPTTPLTALGSTIFLSCGYNRFVDGSSLTSSITVGSGTPQVQAFQPFSPTAPYTPAAYGGSGYFSNVPGNNLLTPASSSFAIGTGQFTVEAWVYLGNKTDISGNGGNAVISQGDNANNLQWSLTLLSNGTGLTWGLTGSQASVTTPIRLNSWVHVAVSRDASNSEKIFVNGALVNTRTNTTNYNGVSGYQIQIASGFDSNLPSIYSINAYSNTLLGYISNLRLVIGTAVYTAAFTPPTAPVTNITNTKLLLNFTNAGIYDATTQNVVSTVGNAQVGTGQFKWSPSSMLFDGSGDWLTAIDNPQLQLGTGDFTIEGWFYLSLNNTAYGIVSKGAASTGWSVNVTSGNRIQFSYTAANLTGSTTTLAQGSWYYFAVVRSGTATGNLKIYLNGNLEVTSGGAVNDNFNQTDILYVGASRTGTTALNGYLQDIRITKAARPITASPAAPFPVQ
jgi:hypothetical protein